MPVIPDEPFGLAFDMFGCPNRCRHCYVGRPPRTRIAEDGLRSVVEQFRAYRRPAEREPLWRQLRVATWVWEPDCSPDYRRLYELENELSDLPSQRAEMEVMSVWRLARDPEYAEWASSIGVRVCQISFFGLEAVTDWAHRRRGAFRDALLATERLLTAGIRPRWQWFFTKPILPDLSRLIKLAEEMHVRERCESLGGPFTLFMNCPWPDGEAWHLESLRPAVRDLQRVPTWLREQSERHIGGPLGEPEGKLVRELREEHGPVAGTAAELAQGGLWFFIMGNLDVYSNLGPVSPAWRLGNLKTDGLTAIVDVFEKDRTPGLQAAFRTPVSELAVRFGRSRGRRLYTSADLKARWVRLWVDAVRTGATDGQR